MTTIPHEKRCSICREVKSIDLFHHDRQKKDGYDHRCKECRNSGKRAKRNKPRILKQADPNAIEKTCTRCEQTKPLTGFYKNKASFDGFQPICCDCQRAYRRKHHEENTERINRRNAQWRVNNPERNHALKQRHYLKTKYGLTIASYQALLDQQDRKCAICGDEYRHTNSSIGPLEIDHDHVTGAVRGLLCRSCNAGIGLFGDSVEKLRAAIAYIERAKG